MTKSGIARWNLNFAPCFSSRTKPQLPTHISFLLRMVVVFFFVNMLFTLLGRHLVQSMVVFYTALVCTTVLQSTLLGMSTPPITNDEWFIVSQNSLLRSAKDFAKENAPPQQRKALALLYPPGIVGGYRNQVMRLIGFLHYARIHDVQELLLPTMLWTTTYTAAKDEKRFYPVPMSTLFDVPLWNSFSDQLPILVNSIENGDCWQPHTIDDIQILDNDPPRRFVSPMAKDILLSSAFLTPLRNISSEILSGALNIQTRKLDLLPLVGNCSRPLVYGGGKGAGRLWNDYVRLPKAHGTTNDTNPLALETTKLISVVSKALKPAKQWREVAHQCIGKRHEQSNTKVVFGREKVAPYIALHARVEVDMLIHRCAKTMEKNLTTILNMVESFQHEHEYRYSSEAFQGIFVAVSRRGLLHPTKEEWVQPLLKENWKALTSMGDRNSNFFECGEEMMENWYASHHVQHDYYGSILPSILNFYIATKAKVFIGVSKSSWSTDVWTTRYYQGKGNTNFEYTPNGIVPVPNGGLPPPHGNCD